MNQMTTKITTIGSQSVPALGVSWSHMCNNRIELYQSGRTLYAKMFKSSNRKCDTVPYCITVSKFVETFYHMLIVVLAKNVIKFKAVS